MERVYRRGRIWWGAYYADGERVRRSTRCTDRRAAEAIVRGWERDAADPAHAAATAASIRDALTLALRRAEDLARTGRRSEATASYYRAKLGHLSRLLEPAGQPVPLARLTASTVDAYLEQRRVEGASEHTLSKELGALRVALRLARRVGLWRGDPAEVLPVLHASEYVPRTRWLTVDEVARLLGELVADRAARVAWIVATGSRWSESDAARRGDATAREVVVRGTKTAAAARVVPVVLPEQRELLALAEQHAEGTDGRMFAAWGNVRRDLAAACSRARIAPATPNDLRRTFAHWLRQRGASADLVAPTMGHVDSRMVERVYGRLRGEELRAALLRCTTGVSDSAARADSADSLDSAGGSDPRENRQIAVPRDGIEPPTRGFSSLVLRRVTPRNDTCARTRGGVSVTPACQRRRRA